MRAFLEEFNLGQQARILDVGGTPDIWSTTRTSARVFLLNLPRARTENLARGFLYVEGDGCGLPFRDQSFDVVFSNSVIEHVESAEAQKRFAREVARVGKGYWVQTPNRYFPIETHLVTPLLHMLPKAWAAFLAQRFTVWALIHRPSPADKQWYLHHILQEVRLCSKGDLGNLFPDGCIQEERFCFLTKSLIAVRKG